MCFCFLQGNCGSGIQQLEIILTAHLSIAVPYWWGQVIPVWGCLYLPLLRILAGLVPGIVQSVHCQESYCVSAEGIHHCYKICNISFHSNPRRKEFHLYLPNTFYVSTQNFSLKPHIIASHLTDHPHRYTYCHFCGKSVCQKTLIALYVRTLNCNKFMYAAAPLLENKFYLLINWCFFLVSTKTKIYTRGSEP